jgi:hypothetical protein
MVKAPPTMVKAPPTMVEIDSRWIFILFNKLILVFDHGREGSDHGLCLFANVFVSPTMGFVSSPMFSCLRPWSLLLRQCFRVSGHGLCFFANVFVSPTMVFASSPMFSCLRPWALPLRQCFRVFDHGRYACEHCLRKPGDAVRFCLLEGDYVLNTIPGHPLAKISNRVKGVH